ncbi:MAG: tetratricopeptide repeat protein [Gammaproteobacteria bacterium]|nr:tetratricopeptide repeat protein [Gammaproteobacteria bacterium]
MLLLVFAAPATWACDDWLAKAVAITGAVERKSAAIDWQQLQVEQTVCPGDSVRVGPNSRAALYLRNNSFVRLDENSLLDFPAQQQEDGFLLGLSQGFAHFISRIVNRFEVSTPYVNAVVEGTEFIVSASPAAAGVAVMEGKVKTYNDAGTESITSGQQVQATSRTASLTRINVPSASRVEWAIHYPPVLTLQNIQPVSAEEKARLDALTPFLQQNRPDLALQSLEQNPAASPALDLARASLLLAVGRSDEFDALIPALLQGPQAGTAHALKAVADAARNRAEPALASAHKAVELAPQQAASHIALSYAQQASLQLDDALASAKKATDVEPANALAWLRLVELRLTQGDIGAAKKALAQIDKLPPEQQQPQVAILSAKGFVNLFSLNLKTARDNFQDALKQDSADPQNHLGLGLALLRDGKLEDGRRQLEYAVSLDPLRSTLRSYLGRAYFEEKRDGEAIKQWDLAKQFDPNDPTPYFYTGVHKLFANDPIGAVDELEKSKELNDKRDIYRSETLLQSDAASRSATLARAYDEVGYDQGVLLNGWDAIRRDPTNSEGHRLLADKYAGDPRYETARVSELLQSQLWQPLSAYPLQPQLSESDLSVVAGAGPQRPSFNEYHSLFTQDGVYGMANGYGGSDGTWGDDLVGSFLAGPVALSLGQFHFESDGWRKNADQEQDIYNGFMQVQLSPDTSIQLESRNFQWDHGDLTPQWEGKGIQIVSETEERETNRFGIVHYWSPRNAVLLSYSRQQLDNSQEQVVTDNFSELRLEQSPETLEVQGITKTENSRFVYGVGSTRVDIESSLASSVSFFDGAGLPTFIDVDITLGEESVQRQDNAYGYVYWSPQNSTDFQFGVEYVDMSRSGDVSTQTITTTQIPLISYVDVIQEQISEPLESDQDRWSPKLGMLTRLTDDLTLRVAAFKAVSKVAAANQSVEPVTVVGFNQFYGDRDGLQSRNGGIGLDYSAGSSWRVGASFVRRLIDDVRISDGSINTSGSITENLGDLYLTYIFSTDFYVRTAYKLAELQDPSSETAIDGVVEAKNESVPLEFSWFASNHLSLAVRGTYYRHDFTVAGPGDDLSVRDSAYVTDFLAEYRLPRRLGVIGTGVNNIGDNDTGIVQYKEGGVSYLGFYPSRFYFLRFSLNF